MTANQSRLQPYPRVDYHLVESPERSMPFEINLEEGERLIASLSFVVPKDPEAFRIAVTDRAVFLPRKKFFAVKDPTYCERVLLSQVVDAKVKTLNPFFLWTLALLMVIAGAVTTGLMLL